MQSTASSIDPPTPETSPPPAPRRSPQGGISPQHANPSAFPTPRAGRSHFIRTIYAHSDVTGELVGHEYISTGQFADSATRATQDEVRGTHTVSFDADLVDYLEAQLTSNQIADYVDRYRSSVFKPGKDGSGWRAPSEISQRDVLKYALHVMPDDELGALKADHYAEVMPALSTAVGVAPTVAVDSGFGGHFHFWLEDGQGDVGEDVDPAVVTQFTCEVIGEVNAVLGYDALDPAVKNPGARLLRELGTVNEKGAVPRPVELVGGDNTVRLDLSTYTPQPAPGSSSATASGEGWIDDDDGLFSFDLAIEVPRKKWAGTVIDWARSGPREEYGGGVRARICCPSARNQSDSAWIHARGQDVRIRCDVPHHEHTKDGRTSWRMLAFDRADEVEIAEAMRDEMADHIVFDLGSFYEYDEAVGAWKEWSDHRLTALAADLAGLPTRKGPLKLRHGQIRGASAILKSREAQPGFFDGRPSGFAFSNGFFSVDGSLEPLGPEHRVLENDIVDYPYDPNAPCPQFLTFLESVFLGDADSQEKQAFLQEYIGVAMLGFAPRFQRHPVLLGRRASNGKSVLTGVVHALFPPAMVISSPPTSWGSGRFGKVQLVHARMNVVAELSTVKLADAGVVKAVLSGDPVEAERKGVDAITIRPRCGHIFGTNSLPHTSDRSEGFFRRFIVVGFNRRFTMNPVGGEEQADPDLTEKLLEEIPGIAAWAIEGALRMLGAQKYTTVPSHAELVEEWRVRSNAVAAFVDEKLEEDANGKLPASEIAIAYRQWAEAQGLKKLSDAAVKTALLNLGFSQGRSSHGKHWNLKWRAGAGQRRPNLPMLKGQFRR